MERWSCCGGPIPPRSVTPVRGRSDHSPPHNAALGTCGLFGTAEWRFADPPIMRRRGTPVSDSMRAMFSFIVAARQERRYTVVLVQPEMENQDN